MIRLTLDEVATATGGRLDAGTDPAAVVSGGVTLDSRSIGAGDLFVAIAGNRVDGHDFAASAVADGAVAVLAEHPVGVPAVLVDHAMTALGRLARAVRDRLPELTVIGVTGSVGKTSTKDLLAAVLAQAGPTVATAGSFNNELGLPLTTLRVEPRTRFLLVEMGARGIGHIDYLCGITRPDIGLVLNVGTAHLGAFGSQEAIARGKGELVESLPDAGLAVLNADDPLVVAMADRTKARVAWTALAARPGVQLWAEQIKLDDQARAGFDLVTANGRAPVALSIHGEHQVANALAAAAVGLEVGLSLAEVARALSGAGPASRWRMEISHRADGLVVVNDAFNANPDSVAAALHALVAMVVPGADGRRWGRAGGDAGAGAGRGRRASGDRAAGRRAGRVRADRGRAGCGADRRGRARAGRRRWSQGDGADRRGCGPRAGPGAAECSPHRHRADQSVPFRGSGTAGR